MHRPITEGAVYHNARVAIYPGYYRITVCNHPLFNEGYEALDPSIADDDTNTDCDIHTVDKDRSQFVSINRAKSKLRDLCLLNEFDFFFTGTFSPHKVVSRSDSSLLIAPLESFLKNQVSRYGIKYIIVPEPHPSSGAIHVHGFLSNLPQSSLNVAINSFNNNPISNRDGTSCFNWVSWSRRFGFNLCCPIYGTNNDGKLKTSLYVSKYLTKSNEKIFGKYYLSSRNLCSRTPQYIYFDTICNFVDTSLKQIEVASGVTIWQSNFLPGDPSLLRDDVKDSIADLCSANVGSNPTPAPILSEVI